MAKKKAAKPSKSMDKKSMKKVKGGSGDVFRAAGASGFEYGGKVIAQNPTSIGDISIKKP
ncbi:MAG TPA: hypothetical protein VE981_18960 [Planctomycetota bacterium]|nr:hypothetical protein [Planctomycetota bacterium]